MVPEQSTLQLAYAVSVVTSIALCGILWRHREKTGAIPLSCYVLSGLAWAGIQLVSVTIDDPGTAAILHRFLYVGIAFGVASLFVFALEYTGRERYLDRKTYLALSVHPLCLLLLAVVGPTGLFFGAIEPDPSTPLGIAPEYGIAMVVHLAYSYLLVCASALMFIDMLYRSRSLYRGQSAALVGGAVLPAVPPLLLVFGVLEFDATPIAIPIASALFTVAIVRYRLIDLVPIARDRIVENVNDGVFVVDENERLIDVNPEGRRILRTIGNDDGRVVGRSFESLLPDTPIKERYEAIAERREETTLEVSIGDNYFQVTATPIDDGRDRHVGWLVIAHDITERKRREQRLERQNERLEEFASIVSHDLRNPLTVADGYLDLARETDDNDEYLERIDRAHDRMETIIEDVLALAREGSVVTDPEPADLATVAERAWESVETGDATLEVRSNGSVRADPDRLRRLLENLFRNSVEHGSMTPDSRTDEPPLTVAVGVTPDDGPGVAFYVADDGPGIPPDRRERVFEAGYSTADDGTGFGLSIVDRIAEAHGWTVTATESETGGARFEFTGVDGETAREPSVPADGSAAAGPDSRSS